MLRFLCDENFNGDIVRGLPPALALKKSLCSGKDCLQHSGRSNQRFPASMTKTRDRRLPVHSRRPPCRPLRRVRRHRRPRASRAKAFGSSIRIL